MADAYLCRPCRKVITATKNNRYRTHHGKDGERCENSSAEIPPQLLEQGPNDPKAPADVPQEGKDFATCPNPDCGKKVQLTRLGYFMPHSTTLYGGDRCLTSGVRAFHARGVKDVELPEKPIDESVRPTGAKPVKSPVSRKETTSRAPISASADAVSSPPELPPGDGGRTELSSPDVTAEPAPDTEETSALPTAEELLNSPESTTTSSEPSSYGRVSEASGMVFRQPGSPFLQPPEWTGTPKPEPMSDLAKELATKIKETFYSYSNRRTTDNRSAQTTLGPSEIGTPCDRRLAMALLGILPVNPGGDGWAAFVGTCTHVGMAEVYTFADAGTGRYAVELPVFLGTPTVPRGTTDLLDRRDATVVDWKVMGKYSLDKFKKEGPTETYRTQGHVYGLGVERSGEKVKNIAIVGLPRAGSSLDEMHVWVEKYDRKFAQAALDRVEKISNEIARQAGQVAYDGTGPSSPMESARSFETGDDCKYCPFHLKGDKEMRRGCPGK